VRLDHPRLRFCERFLLRPQAAFGGSGPGGIREAHMDSTLMLREPPSVEVDLVHYRLEAAAEVDDRLPRQVTIGRSE
jgi:hypothetical protein